MARINPHPFFFLPPPFIIKLHQTTLYDDNHTAECWRCCHLHCQHPFLVIWLWHARICIMYTMSWCSVAKCMWCFWGACCTTRVQLLGKIKLRIDVPKNAKQKCTKKVYSSYSFSRFYNTGLYRNTAPDPSKNSKKNPTLKAHTGTFHFTTLVNFWSNKWTRWYLNSHSHLCLQIGESGMFWHQ